MTVVGAALARTRLLRPRRGRGLVFVASTILMVFGLAALLAPVLAPHDPLAPDLSQLYQGPSSAHLLGTDSNGRDLLSRLIYGGRTALLGPLTVAVAATLIGAGLAFYAAWRGGWVDAVVSRGFDLLFAFPGLLLAIIATATFGKGLTAAAVALAISYTPYVGRIVRAAASRERSLPYVTALQAAGFGGLPISARHVLPNLRPLIISQAAVLFGYAMIDLAAVSFLGLGVQQPTPDWGSMIASGLSGILAGFPQESIYAGVLVVVTVAAVNILGERLGERSDVRP